MIIQHCTWGNREPKAPFFFLSLSASFSSPSPFRLALFKMHLPSRFIIYRLSPAYIHLHPLFIFQSGPLNPPLSVSCPHALLILHPLQSSFTLYHTQINGILQYWCERKRHMQTNIQANTLIHTQYKAHISLHKAFSGSQTYRESITSRQTGT